MVFPELPLPAEQLVPQRPPMLLVGQLLRRAREPDEALAEADVPLDGIFIDPNGQVLPEYFVELVAQAMAAVNGYDSLVEGASGGKGFLVGIDGFTWPGTASPGDHLRVEITKVYEFGPVSVMHGIVLNDQGFVLASGDIKAWEEPS
ncbi:MAG: ACP dehydratase [Proteobacteria bacterium]|nr:ACP dehydratase [Pseudomonadota bacterium]MBU1685860.1 ACP dehydratase [Pseudomonadota bacterium]